MVDKGFFLSHWLCESKGVKFYFPPFKSELQFSGGEVETTGRIALQEFMGEEDGTDNFFFFRILQGIMHLAISDLADQIFFVCAALTNLLPPLVSE